MPRQQGPSTPSTGQQNSKLKGAIMNDLLTFIFTQDDLFRWARLPSLYSDFTPQRTSNPDGFAANVSAWIEVLARAAKADLLPFGEGQGHSFLSLDVGESLIRALETKEWGRPLALSTVIEEAASQRRILPYETFVNSSSLRPRMWLNDPRSIVSWAWEQVRSFGVPHAFESTLSGRFVFMAHVEEASSTILAGLSVNDRLVDRIYPMSSFRQECARLLGLKNGLHDNDLKILLVSLARDQGAIVYSHDVVKFTLPGNGADTLTAGDSTIASLKSLIEELNVQIKLLSTRIDTAAATARCAIGHKNRTSALAALKSRKLNEGVMIQRTETLFQLERLYHDIEQAGDQVAMVRVMKDSTHVLRELNAQVGGTEGAEIIAENAQVQMSNIDEVGRVISEAGQNLGGLDEKDVDEELKELMRQEDTKEEVADAQRLIERLAQAPCIEDSKLRNREDYLPATRAVSNPAMNTLTLDADAIEDTAPRRKSSLQAGPV